MRILIKRAVVWVVVALFAWVVVFGVVVYGQEPAPASTPARPPLPLAVSPQYGEGATAVWWVRSAATTVVMLLSRDLNGNTGCYAALDFVATPPRAYVYNVDSGTWGGAGKLCRVGLERVPPEHGGGVLVRAVLFDAWAADTGAGGTGGKQHLWLLERDAQGAGNWVRVGVWVVAPDAGGVAWVGGSGVPPVGWVPMPEPAQPPEPEPPPPPQPSPPPVETTLKRDINDLYLWRGPAGVVFRNGTLQGRGDYVAVPGVGIRTLSATPWEPVDTVTVLGFRFSTFPSAF